MKTKTKKIRKNATLAEQFEWKAECARHQESGGDVIFVDTIGNSWGLKEIAESYEIILQPEVKYVPYTSADAEFLKQAMRQGLTVCSDNYEFSIISVSDNGYTLGGIFLVWADKGLKGYTWQHNGKPFAREATDEK